MERAIVTAQDYIRSYYAATANDQTRYPALEGTVKMYASSAEDFPASQPR